jgi:hypothetical protein
MKTIRFASAIALALALLIGASALTAGAAGPVGTSPNNAPYIDNQPHAIDGYGSLWLRFDYAITDTGDRPVSTITLVNGDKDNVGFEVWTPDGVNDMADNKPIGRGTPYNVDCDTGELSGQGACRSNDLVWSGAFGESGTYYVKIINNNASPESAQLLIQGNDVSLGLQAPPTVTPNAVSSPSAAPTTNPTVASSPTAAPTTDATVAPSPTTEPTAIPTGVPSPTTPPTAVPITQPAPTPAILTNLDDPNKAMLIDDTPHILAAKSAVWYRFDYGISDTGDHPVRTIILVNGNNSGVRFEVWAPNNLDDWWDKQPHRARDGEQRKL